ncbi:polysaccharide pyruvyl transferase family protein [Evansella sp. AB-rgal1]|uniref:polysaccharide pyruvyl transferase family protein n=1 Tax=Evansella sp. AB-rgal1 TaxID=3242696 RepID=UPI00359EB54F
MNLQKVKNNIQYQKRRFNRIMLKVISPIEFIKLYFKIRKKDQSRIFIIGTPLHGNLGDHAIAYAEKTILEGHLGNFEVIDIQFNEVNQSINLLKRFITEKDIIVLNGGGNFGIEYFEEEELRRKFILSFPEQKIVVFPQTIYFGNSERAQKELIKTKTIYNAHQNLVLIAREEKSFLFMEREFNYNRVLLTPDIVLYLNESESKQNRNGIIFCFRKDVEGILDSNYKEQLIKDISLLNNKIIITDTVVNKLIAKSKREIEVKKIWSQFRNSQLVITDRLHGMVFAAITGTPCIVFNNYNHKVKGTYEWIKHLPYIRFVENKDNIMGHVNELLKLDQSILEYDNTFAMKYYKEIIEIIDSAKINEEDSMGGDKIVERVN